MEAFEQLDFLGDAVLKLLAYKRMPSNPFKWERTYASNAYLASLYDRVMLVNNYPTSVVYQRALKKGTKKKFKLHFKASCVEGWLGIAYKHGGIKEAEKMWERLHKIPK